MNQFAAVARSSAPLPIHPCLASEPAQRRERRSARRVDMAGAARHVATLELGGSVQALPLHDLSLGGVGLCATAQQARDLKVGTVLRGVRLELGPALVMVADLEVRVVRPMRGGERVRVGCSLVSIAMRMRGLAA